MKNEIGNRYGRLTVIRYDHTDKRQGAYWLCACDCGCTSVVKGNRLRNGKTKSCGCLKREAQENLGENTKEISSARMKEFNKVFWTEENRQRNREAATKHGGTGTRLFSIWSHMRERCNRENGDHATWYHDKGIRVCDEWDGNFELFREWSYANGYHEQQDDTPYKEMLSIDRIDPNKGYSPANCQWISVSQNSIRRNQYHANQR